MPKKILAKPKKILPKKTLPKKTLLKKILLKKTLPKKTSGTPAKTIMVVDDEPDIRMTVKQVLERKGYTVVSAVNGDDCLKKINSGEKPDLILMDIMMPGTPVKDVVKKLGKFKIAYLSVVRISEAEKEDLANSKNIVDFIQKPFDIEKLLQSVKKLVG